MSERKFRPGDRVRMTKETLRSNPNTLATKGTVVKYQPRAGYVEIYRDGLTRADPWCESAWELDVELHNLSDEPTARGNKQ